MYETLYACSFLCILARKKNVLPKTLRAKPYLFDLCCDENRYDNPKA